MMNGPMMRCSPLLLRAMSFLTSSWRYERSEISPVTIESGTCSKTNKNSTKANFVPSWLLRIFFIFHSPFADGSNLNQQFGERMELMWSFYGVGKIKVTFTPESTFSTCNLPLCSLVTCSTKFSPSPVLLTPFSRARE